MTAVASWTPSEVPDAPDLLTANVRCTCVGETPILLGAMDEDRILDIVREEPALRMPEAPRGLSRDARVAWRREHCHQPIAAAGIPRRDGQPGIPSEYLMRCLIEAGEWVPHRERMMLTDATKPRGKKQGGSLVPTFIAIAEEFLPFPNDAWELDLRRSERNKRRVWIARAKFPMWGFHATIRYDPNELRKTTVQRLVEVAGFRIGLGSFRKDPRTPYHGKRAVFGRFRVEEWE